MPQWVDMILRVVSLDKLSELSKKKNGIIWEFSPNGRYPPPLGNFGLIGLHSQNKVLRVSEKFPNNPFFSFSELT